jgi:hypothetical protein
MPDAVGSLVVGVSVIPTPRAEGASLPPPRSSGAAKPARTRWPKRHDCQGQEAKAAPQIGAAQERQLKKNTL